MLGRTDSELRVSDWLIMSDSALFDHAPPGDETLC